MGFRLGGVGMLLALSLRMTHLLAALAPVWLLPVWLAAPPSGVATLLPVWLAVPPPGAATRVLPEPEGFLVGTERGLYRNTGNTGDGWSLVLARGAVLDLVQFGSGWLAAAEHGLYEAQEEAVARVHKLGAGARAVSLAVDDNREVWVATDAGLYRRRESDRDFVLDTSLPAGPVRAVRAAGGRVWISRDRELWVREPDGSWTAHVRGVGEGWWELVGAAPTADGTLLAVPRGLWRVEGPRAQRIEHTGGDLRALALSDRWVWLASTRGLLRTRLERLDNGVPEMIVEGEAFDAVSSEAGLLVLNRNGVGRLLRVPVPAGMTFGSRRAYRRPSVDPGQLQRAAIAYQGLTPSRLRRLSEQARSTAWLPQVRLTAGWDQDLERDRKQDQTISSGAIHRLLDSASTRDTSYGVDVQLTWDLARVAEPDEQLAISRERRELVELRDQVLERVNRLHFERLRVLEQRDRAPAQEKGALSLRARELAAQLDAWTGGQFSRLESATPNPRSTP